MKLYEGYEFDINAIALGRDCNAEVGVFAFVEDENGLRVSEIKVSFYGNSNTFSVLEMFYFDDGIEFIEDKSFCIYDYTPDVNFSSLENDEFKEIWKEANEERNSALMSYLEKRFQELKELEEKGELKNYLIENGYTESQIEENIQQNQQLKSKRRK